MARVPVHYRNLRIRNITSPQYRHLLLLLGWIPYFIGFFLTERLIPPERCFLVHCPLDDRIPFCEGFLVPYVLWYGLVAGSLLYYLFYDVARFRKLQIYILVTQILGMGIFLLLPSRQELRPGVFPRENLLTRGVGLLYRVDTSTGVCPSMHAAWSMALASVWSRDREAKLWIRAGILGLCISICLSTVFLKQHSVLDVLAAVPVCLIAEAVISKSREP